MMLKRLEMHGFKSFAKKAVFDFTAPVTAIVGPNGSGKSNVVEAIRFVLGEQSTKSLRSKSGADLIFKGSKQIGKMSRARVAMTFDNSKRVFTLPALEEQKVSLDFDEITIAREVFSDGGNTYSLNGNEVRLKDIHELIASVNIGSSGHHIISQGEADRLLNAKANERREMLEESLGLKLYHYRIKESERKLEKTREHIREAESIRRELSPHIRFLKKQVEKIEKAQELADTLKNLYRNYLVQEQTIITRKERELVVEVSQIESALKDTAETLSSTHEMSASSEMMRLEGLVLDHRTRLKKIAVQKDEVGRHLGRIEGMIESATRIIPAKAAVASIPVSEIEALISECEASTEITIRDIIGKLKRFVSDRVGTPAQEIRVDTSEFEVTKKELEQTLRGLDEESESIESALKKIESEMEQVRQDDRDRQKAFYELQARKNDLLAKQDIVRISQERIQERSRNLAEEYIQAEHLVGSWVIDLKQHYLAPEEGIDESALKALAHELERTKIRLEDMGGGGGGDVMQEYEETKTRDEFLEREISDLSHAIGSLESTIAELKEKLGKEFASGISKINKEFETFFKLMFGGGEAKLALVAIEKRKKKEFDEEGNEIPLAEENEEQKEQGIEIDVSLPRKKVKDLEMLSGGERSLTSIALLFALSQVNPPPFLVLDETDAALDEANSQKYGDMIENLAQQTQLMVVTHNRETMSRANILYGVTLGSDDCSTLLSIKFEEAVKVAK